MCVLLELALELELTGRVGHRHRNQLTNTIIIGKTKETFDYRIETVSELLNLDPGL